VVEVTSALLGVSIILFVGFLAEFLFKKLDVPDILILIILGFIIGPFGLKYVTPSQLSTLAPIFTTFALLFLLFDGAFSMSLQSLTKGAVKSTKITIFNFTLSAIVVSVIAALFGIDLKIALLLGFILGGISSAFVIPIIQQLKIKGATYSILTIESAITDVLCIVSAFTLIQIITLNTFSISNVLLRIFGLFFIAGTIGIIAGILWIIITIIIFKEHKSYMITIAYLILIYVITEYLSGNGTIATLFFGLVLSNSMAITRKLLAFSTSIGLIKESRSKKLSVKYEVHVITTTEKFFYSQISFLLKTFFFVYIGILFDLSQLWLVLIGSVIAIAILFTRRMSKYLTKDLKVFDQELIAGIFARGLAAAAITQIVIEQHIPNTQMLPGIVYSTIIFTIILSSASIFWLKKKYVTK
jgi:NhaP-type Na+/H+ or K+/H+ antiporter